MDQYVKGTHLRVTVQFEDLTGVATDPTTVTASVRTPDGTITSYVYPDAAMSKEATGKYHLDLDPLIPGVWMFRWAGAGACIAADESEFAVLESVFV